MPMKNLRPADYVAAIERNGGSRVKAARELGVGIRQVFKVLAKLKARGQPIPQSCTPPPEDLIALTEAAHQAAPEHFHVKGVSSYIGKDGELRGQWIKTDQDGEQRAAMLRAAAEELAKTITPQAPVDAPGHTLETLCNLYTITDYHVGMLAWRKEGGADWDLGIAERTLTRCFAHLVENAPRSRKAVVYQGGDFLHTDGFLPLTPASKHVLDADSRFPKIVEVAVRALRGIVNQALTKHELVHVIMEEGNHDETSSVWLRALFGMLYENEPRVTVEKSPLPYHAYQHGRTMLAFHHGHKKKVEKLPGFMAAQFPQMWGETVHRYCHTGHLHHTHEKEDNGMTVVQHPTLAARDAFAARGGWHADRAAKAISYHEEYGEVGRTLVTPEMVL